MMRWRVLVQPGGTRRHPYEIGLREEDRAVEAAAGHAALLAGHLYAIRGDPYAVIETEPERRWEVISPYGETLHTVTVIDRAKENE